MNDASVIWYVGFDDGDFVTEPRRELYRSRASVAQSPTVKTAANDLLVGEDGRSFTL
jgi:hypothetical protein